MLPIAPGGPPAIVAVGADTDGAPALSPPGDTPALTPVFGTVGVAGETGAGCDTGANELNRRAIAFGTAVAIGAVVDEFEKSPLPDGPPFASAGSPKARLIAFDLKKRK